MRSVSDELGPPVAGVGHPLVALGDEVVDELAHGLGRHAGRSASVVSRVPLAVDVVEHRSVRRPHWVAGGDDARGDPELGRGPLEPVWCLSSGSCNGGRVTCAQDPLVLTRKPDHQAP